jgi:hypothetical protein
MKNTNNFFITKKLFTVIPLALLLLSGCASMPAPQVDSRILVWKNVKIDELVKYWGLPNRQSKIGESHVAEWINQKSSDSNTAISVGTGSYGSNSSIGLGLTLFNIGGGDEVCQRQVTYSIKGDILNIIWSGDTDFCFELTPDKNIVYVEPKAAP